jgi:hypothetical protein
MIIACVETSRMYTGSLSRGCKQSASSLDSKGYEPDSVNLGVQTCSNGGKKIRSTTLLSSEPS